MKKGMSDIILGFTKEYQDARWRKCRHGKDLRECLDYQSTKTSTGEFHIICKCDGQPCDAKWIGDKDPVPTQRKHTRKQNPAR